MARRGGADEPARSIDTHPDRGRTDVSQGEPGEPVDRPISPPDGPAASGEMPARTASSTLVVAVGFVGVAACLLAFGAIAQSVRAREADALDQVVTPILHRMASPALDALMNAATFTGSNAVIIPAYVVVMLALLRLGRRREALFLTTVVAGSLLLNGAMKGFFQRPRPQLPWAQVLPDYSFPSGHSMISLAFFLALAIVVWQARGRRWGGAAIVAAFAGSLLIGVSRIYLGYHYLTDVLAGYLAAVLWLLVVLGAFGSGSRLLVRYRRPRRIQGAVSGPTRRRT